VDVFVALLPRFAAATWLTVWLFVVVTILSTLIGGLCAVLAALLGPWFSRPLGLYCWIFRGLPELVVLLACYLALPSVGLDLGSIGAAILGFTLIGTAFETEIFRAGLAAVDRHQFEAARALGIPRWTAMRRLILPQVMRIIVPPWVTFAAGNVKAMSVASAIAVTDIMAVTRQAISLTNQPFTMILLASAIYVAIASLLMVAEALYVRRYGTQRGRA
jgi:His/Glu/Gln/Arg/opine family amino acid ABC transporter permease subunit